MQGYPVKLTLMSKIFYSASSHLLTGINLRYILYDRKSVSTDLPRLFTSVYLIRPFLLNSPAPLARMNIFMLKRDQR
jgi:hypothetical protein